MTQQYDEWDLASGLPLAGADVTVTNAEFRIDSTYAIGAVVLALTFTPDPDDTGKPSTPQTQLYSLGANWEIREHGATVINIHETATKKLNFSEQSNYGRLLKAVKGVPGGRDGLAGRGSIRNASTWIGTRWTLGTVKIMTGKPKANDQKERDLIVPVAWLGTADGVAAGVPAGAPAAGAGARGGAALAGEDRDYLVQLAMAVVQNGGDHDTFMAQAFDDAKVLGSPAMQNAVTETGEGSVWAEAQTAGAEAA